MAASGCCLGGWKLLKPGSRATSNHPAGPRGPASPHRGGKLGGVLMPRCGATCDEVVIPFDNEGLQWGGTQPTPSLRDRRRLRATPPREGIFKGERLSRNPETLDSPLAGPTE